MRAVTAPEPDGDMVKLSDVLANVEVHGVVSEPDSPMMIDANLLDTSALADVSSFVGELLAGIIQGPPGPPGEPALPDGVRPSPGVRFEIDGWEYSFPSVAAAEKVRDKLMAMTLEGELYNNGRNTTE